MGSFVNRLAIIVLCILSAVAGVFIGRLSDSGESESKTRRPRFQPPAAMPPASSEANGQVDDSGPSFEDAMALLQDEERSSFLERLEVNLAIASMSESEIRRALDILKPNVGTKSEAKRKVLGQMRMLLTYWGELDPNAALSYAGELDEDSRKNLMGAIISGWAKDSPYEALAYARSIEDEKSRNELLRSVSTALSKDDPVGALELLDSLPRPSGRNRYSWSSNRAVIIKEWAKIDQEAALAYVYGIENNQDRKQLLQNLSYQFVEVDPMLALSLASEADDRWFNSSGNVISNWTRHDKGAAWAYLQSLSDSQYKSRLVGHYFSQAGNEDPHLTIGLIQSSLTGETRKNSLSTVFSNWVRNDYDSAIAYIETLPSGKDRNDVINSIAYSLAEANDPDVALAWVMENATGRTQTNAMRSIIDRLSQKDPAKAVNMLNTLPYGRSYSNAVRTLADNWGSHDPEAAYNWISSLPDGPERENAFRSLSRGAAQLDADRAYVIATQMPEGKERTQMLTEIASAKAKNDPQSTANWVMSFPDEKLRNSAMRQVVDSWAEIDPLAAAQFLQSGNGTNVSDDTYKQLASRWARQDPQAAADWALTLPEGKQEDAISGVTRSWLDQDMYAASEWVSTLPAGDARQKAVGSLVYKVSRVEPDAAFDWVLEIENERQRKSLTHRIAREWKKRDVTTARQLVSASTLPEGEKEALLKQLE